MPPPHHPGEAGVATEDVSDIEYVYVVHNPDRRSCKIGRSLAPETRLKAFRTDNDSDLRITFKLGMDRALAPRVERLARRIAVQDHRKPKTREWL